MAKRENPKDGWLDKMADHVLQNGLEAASLRPLAKAAGTSDRMLIYYFADKTGLISSILQTIASRLMQLMVDHGAQEALPYEACLQRTVSILSAEVFAPYLRLFLSVASLSALGNPLYRALGEQLGRAYFEWAKTQVLSVTDKQHAHDAAMLLQRVEGMIFLRAIGLDDINRLAFANPERQ